MERRPQRRTKALKVDHRDLLALDEFAPLAPLRTNGKRVWDHLEENTPFWFTAADVPMITLLCLSADAVSAAMRGDTSAAGRAAILKEARSIGDQLGLSPTSRSRLRLTEAQAATHARKAGADDDDQGDDGMADVIDIDDLLDDAG